jgi:quercetin dioxygenase-like cupin family protein
VVAVILRHFERPDETRQFEKGRFELVTIAGRTFGRATYEPGWRWSLHVGPTTGATRCHVEHLGLVLSGRAGVSFEDGRVIEMRPGQVFYIPPEPHDSWVIGDERYVSLHLMGAEQYARHA